MRQVVQTEAFVLKKNRLTGADTIVTLFTKEQGKIISVAKGVKKITSRRAPHLQTGNLIRSTLASRHDTLYIQETTLISAFSSIKEDMKKMSILFIYYFVLERLLPREQPEQESFHITLALMKELARSESFTKTRLAFYLNALLQSLGFLKENKSYEELIMIVEELMNEKMPDLVI
ncbi:DNA repair protein RecO [Candidatus Roizmanbacteria bacterium]|nr:DNA repair protein RecO [Candidatus Roizmanbacteria bacterium]